MCFSGTDSALGAKPSRTMGVEKVRLWESAASFSFSSSGEHLVKKKTLKAWKLWPTGVIISHGAVTQPVIGPIEYSSEIRSHWMLTHR